MTAEAPEEIKSRKFKAGKKEKWWRLPTERSFGELLTVTGVPPTPGILYEYQNKGLTKFDCCKCMKTKGSTNGCRGVLLHLTSSNREAWGNAPGWLGTGTERPYNGMSKEEKRQHGCRTPKAPRRTRPEVAR